MTGTRRYLERARDTWRHRDLDGAAQDYRGLVHYATLAASSHNTQPWKFKLEQGRVSIFPDLTRRCPIVDPDDHHLFASLGCAAENLLIAARAAGLAGHVVHSPGSSHLEVRLEPAAPSRPALLDAVVKRASTRAEYDGTPIATPILDQLARSARGSGTDVSMLLLTEPRDKERVAEYVAAGNAAQFGDPRWSDEMKRWIRFSAGEAATTGDGLYGAVLGIPNLPRWLGERAMSVAASATAQSRKDALHIRSSSAIAVIVTDVDDPPHWVEAGRAYERLALEAAALDLRTAFINQPVEVPSVRSQLASWLGLGERRPDLIVRIGRGPDMPRSLRRPVEEVLL